MASSLYQNTAPGRPPGPPPPYRQPPSTQPPQPPPPGSFYNPPGYQTYPSHYPPTVPPPPPAGPPAPGAPPPPYHSSNYGSAPPAPAPPPTAAGGVLPNLPASRSSSQGPQSQVQASRVPAQGTPASYSHQYSAPPGASQRVPPPPSHPSSFHPSGQPAPPAQLPSTHPPHQQPSGQMPAGRTGPPGNQSAAHGTAQNPNAGNVDAGTTVRSTNAANAASTTTAGNPSHGAGPSHGGWGPSNASQTSGQGGLPSREPQAAVDMKHPSSGGARLSQPGPSQHGRRAETEAERHERKKREYVARKLEERRQREKALTAAQANPRVNSAVPGKPGPPPANRDPRSEKRAPAVVDKTLENRLKRASTFICKIRFRNELPDPVSQPKLLYPANIRDQYTKYTISSLEKSYKYKLHVDTDLGIPLDLLDISAYSAPKVRPPLDPADAELLLDDEILKKDKPLSNRKKERPTDKGVAWLVKTQYISPVSLDPAKQSLTEKQAKELREMKEGRKEFLDTHNDREQQIQAIEKSFEIAKQLPVHQTKPELKPVEILPLLPDISRWGDQFVHMVFDNETTGDSELFAKLPPHVRDELETRAVVKSYSIPSSDESRPDEKFVGYMVPKVDELDKDMYNDDEEISYSWVREYHWDVRADDARNTYVFCFGKDDVRFMPLHTKLLLQKKKAREGRSKDELENDFAVPASVSVRYVPPTAEDEEARAVAKRNLMEGRGGASVDQTIRLKRGRSPLPDRTLKRPTYADRRPASNRRNVSDDEDDLSV